MITVDVGKCSGCGDCAKACADLPHHKGVSMITLVDVRGLASCSVPTMCVHCSDAPCAVSCPAAAITITDVGVVRTADESRCIGCGNCTLACPFGVPVVLKPENLMVKCDLCLDRLNVGASPACVNSCSSQAISFMKPNVLSDLKRTEAARRIVQAFV